MTQNVPLRERRKLLRAFRKLYGITLVELGKLADLSNPMLSQFERGIRDLSPEAWTRVLAAMAKLLEEDENRRSQERAKAAEIAAKLGAVPNNFSSWALEFVSGPRRKQVELETEKIRQQDVANLRQLVITGVDEHLAELEAEATKPENVPALFRAWKDLMATTQAHNARMADLTAQGYVILPQSVELERDDLKARVAQLEEARALKPFVPTARAYAGFEALLMSYASQLPPLAALMQGEAINVLDKAKEAKVEAEQRLTALEEVQSRVKDDQLTQIIVSLRRENEEQTAYISELKALVDRLKRGNDERS